MNAVLGLNELKGPCGITVATRTLAHLGYPEDFFLADDGRGCGFLGWGTEGGGWGMLWGGGVAELLRRWTQDREACGSNPGAGK